MMRCSVNSSGEATNAWSRVSVRAIVFYLGRLSGIPLSGFESESDFFEWDDSDFHGEFVHGEFVLEPP